MILISYVFYKKNKIQNLIDFLESMTKYPPEKNALLVISLKDLSNDFSSQVHEIVSKYKLNCKVDIVKVPNIGFDLGTHILNTEKYNPFITIFMSASSKANHKNWYNLLISPFADKNVGIVGSMYSEESQFTTYYEIAYTKIKYRMNLKLSKVEECVALMLDLKPKFDTINFGSLHQIFSTIITYIPFRIYRLRHAFDIKQYPPFPNPHLRTTGLAIRSNLISKIVTRLPLTKGDVLALESSYSSLTSSVKNLGYKILVCNHLGKYLNFGDNKARSTFRDTNSTSIVVDLESEKFLAYDDNKKIAIHKLMTKNRVDF